MGLGVLVACSGCGQGAVTHDADAESESGGSGAPEPECVAGAAVACTCEDGREGAQVCADDGEGFGECTCAPAAGCEAPTVGFAPLPRLTRLQYANTVEDLLGVDVHVLAENLAPDERVGPFTSNVGAPVAELQLEQYMDAAEHIAAEAVVDLATLVPCDPTTGDTACAEAMIRQLLPRAFRRPVTDEEVQSILAVYAAGEDFEAGVRIALQAILQSPYFLYRVELGDPDAEGDVRALTAFEYATRLSYFLWDTMPDEGLTEAEASGDLDSEEGRDAAVQRLLADDRSARSIGRFFVQWLDVDELATADKEDPRYDAALGDAMTEETAAFAAYVLQQDDGRLETLLTADYTVTDDAALLALYGASPGDPVQLDDRQRSGLLTQAGFFAAHSPPNQSSPVRRGVVLRQNVLCQTLPPPPPNVDNVPPEPDPNSTTRERFAEHTEDPACAGCHVLIDGLGFGLEHYDAIGAFRTEDGGAPVDASGEIVASDVDGTYEGGVELGRILASSDQVRDCLATQWFRFAIGRGESEADQCTVDTLHAGFAESDGDVQRLIADIALSDAFRHLAQGEPQ